MKTYDYYKAQASHKIYYNCYLHVESDPELNKLGYGDERVRVSVEAPNNITPNAVKKGVWNVQQTLAGYVYIPEGDPEFDETADKLVWGEFKEATA